MKHRDATSSTPEPGTSLGRVDTWIVGIRHHGEADNAAFRAVRCRREPQNPHDANAVALDTEQGGQVGYVPRYDAAWLAPLLDARAIAIHAVAGADDGNNRMPLTLHILDTGRSASLVERDAMDDWRAVFHNMLAELWAARDTLSPDTLKQVRRLLRPVAHDQPLFPKTQMLYRMLKSCIADGVQARVRALRGLLMDHVAHMGFGVIHGWRELAVIALDAPGDTNDAAIPPETETLPGLGDREPEDVPGHAAMGALAARCPYPPGARGMLVLVRNRPYLLDWFADPACAQVGWYAALMDGLQFLQGHDLPTDPRALAPVAFRSHIQCHLHHAAYELQPDRHADGSRCILLHSVELAEGFALAREDRVVRLRLRARHVVGHWLDEPGL